MFKKKEKKLLLFSILCFSLFICNVSAVSKTGHCPSGYADLGNGMDCSQKTTTCLTKDSDGNCTAYKYNFSPYLYYTIKINLNEKTSDDKSSLSCNTDKDYTDTNCNVTLPTLSKSGDTFLGWSEKENDYSDIKTGTYKLTTSSKVDKLYAVWASAVPKDDNSNNNNNTDNNNNNNTNTDNNNNNTNTDNNNNNNNTDNNTGGNGNTGGSNNSNVSGNPQTGEISVFVICVLLMISIFYSVYYYRILRED